VIGASIAYFLSRRGVEATVIERTGLACAASGKAGGFLALDWCDGTPLQALARRSFALHAVDPCRRMAAVAGGVWAEGAQPRIRNRDEGFGRRAVSRIPGVRCDPSPRAVPARRRHDLHMCDLQRKPAAYRPRRGEPGVGCDRALGADLQPPFAGARFRKDPGAAGLLSPGHAGRPAADGPHTWQEECLYCHRPQRLGGFSTRRRLARRWPS
jgi:glycine/D-amino acid oxidase-like deaminating enzyme